MARCSYCYETGHNVKGCKKMKETAVTAAAKPSEDRSSNERYVMAKVEHHKQASKTRACSYCSGESHTRRTCASLKAHVVTRNALESRWRRGIAKALAESPVKIGAFVEWTTWEGGKITAIITGLNIEKLKENDFGVFGLDQFGAGAGRRWVNYTILSVGGEKDRYWGDRRKARFMLSFRLPESTESKFSRSILSEGRRNTTALRSTFFLRAFLPLNFPKAGSMLPMLR